MLETQAPQAILLATIGKQVFKFRAGKPVSPTTEMTPPERWFNAGQLDWLSHDGALLGLIWSPEALPASTLQLFTLLLSTTRGDEGLRAIHVLITQLPESAAWLDDQLRFQQVSHHFLEMYGLTTEQVLGQTFDTVFPERQTIAELLEQALKGKTVQQLQEVLVWSAAASSPLWLRSHVRPYFGEGAGVLWTMQDISGEVGYEAQAQALLGSVNVPTALLGSKGELLALSRTLVEALEERQLTAPQRGQPLGMWPIWGSDATTKTALTQALKQVKAAPTTWTLRLSPVEDLPANRQPERVELQLRQGDTGSLPAELTPLLVAEFHFANQHQDQMPQQLPQLLSSVVQRSPYALLLLGLPVDGVGSERPLWMLSDVAIDLLGLEKSSLEKGDLLGPTSGRPLDEILSKQRIYFSRLDGLPLTTVQVLRQGLKQGVVPLILTRPDGSRRYLEATSVVIDTAQGSASNKHPLSLYLEDVTSKRHLEERLQHHAHYDPLTGLPNWAGLRRSMAASDKGYCLMVLSIDGYNALQAALGRSAGDHLLIQVAAKLHQWRKDIQVARLEGETFALLTTASTPETATRIAQDLQVMLKRPMRVGGREIQLSTSVGISCMDTVSEGAAASPFAAEDQLDQARSALHAAQRTGSGRGAVAFFSSALRAREAELVQLESEVRRAVPEQFTVLFQPIVNLHTGRVQGAELLLRWDHPTKGLISPRLFLPLVERAGLMVTVGQWVLAQAIAFRKQLTKEHCALKLHLNLSAEELNSAEYRQAFEKAMKQVGGLNIELGAGGLLSPEGEAPESGGPGEWLRQMHELGSEIFVDDFGDGAASITALERFALSGVKLHPTFVANLQQGERALALLEGTVALARRVNLQVIAVGIETQAQVQLLRTIGDAAQGYFYAAPKPLNEFHDWLHLQVND